MFSTIFFFFAWKLKFYLWHQMLFCFFPWSDSLTLFICQEISAKNQNCGLNNIQFVGQSFYQVKKCCFNKRRWFVPLTVRTQTPFLKAAISFQNTTEVLHVYTPFTPSMAQCLKYSKINNFYYLMKWNAFYFKCMTVKT